MHLEFTFADILKWAHVKAGREIKRHFFTGKMEKNLDFGDLSPSAVGSKQVIFVIVERSFFTFHLRWNSLHRKHMIWFKKNK